MELRRSSMAPKHIVNAPAIPKSEPRKLRRSHRCKSSRALRRGAATLTCNVPSLSLAFSGDRFLAAKTSIISVVKYSDTLPTSCMKHVRVCFLVVLCCQSINGEFPHRLLSPGRIRIQGAESEAASVQPELSKMRNQVEAVTRLQSKCLARTVRQRVLRAGSFLSFSQTS